MCGIFGLINKTTKNVDQSVLSRATDSMFHRGPDFQHTLIDNSIGLAHCRLKIIDPDNKANQPFQKHNCTLVFNGAIYNFVELREELKVAGYSFTTASDTEVLLSAYDYWGVNCVRHFRGMWAFCIHDIDKRICLISRDQASIKPLYYHVSDDNFAFASEIKVLIDTGVYTPKISEVSIYEFIENGIHDHREESFFEGIRRLKGGHNLIYDIAQQNYSITKFSSIYDESFTIGDDPISEFRSLFFDSLKLVSRMDTPFGSCLSGGLDSSSIVSGMKNQGLLSEHYCSFSACFDGYKYDEQAYINEVSSTQSIRNEKVFPSAEYFKNSIYDLIKIQEEPIAGAGVLSQYLVTRSANIKGYKVLIDGQGGDELLAGYDVFYPYFLKETIIKKPIQGVIECIHSLMNYRNSVFDATLRFIRRRKKTRKKMASWFVGSIDNDSLFHSKEINSIQDLSNSLLQEMGLPALLRYADKNMMHFSIEGRYPFLDQKLVAFCMQLDSSYKIKKGIRKYILREALSDIIPNKIRERRDKIGYATPQNDWLESNKEYFDKLYGNALELSFVDKKAFINNADKDKKWRLMMVKIWTDVFDLDT